LTSHAERTRRETNAHQRFARCRDREALGAWFCEALDSGRHRAGSDPLRLARYVDLGRTFLNTPSESIDLSSYYRKEIESHVAAACDQLKGFMKNPNFVRVSEHVREYVEKQANATPVSR
jgi:hypothetical protein